MIKELFQKFIDIFLQIMAIILAIGFFLLPVITWFMSYDDYGKIGSIILGIFIYGLLIFYEGKTEKIWIEDGQVNYYAEIGSYFQKYITHTEKVINKKIKVADVTDMFLYHYSIQHKGGESLYYRLTVCSSVDSICYEGYEDEGFKEIWQVFKTVYPRLSLNFKRQLINFICDNDLESKKSYKFPVSMYDDCFKLRVIRNPYVVGSSDKYLTCCWSEFEAKLDAKNMSCMLCLDGYEYPVYNFSVKNRPLVWHRFDHYVLCDIINDIHKEKVSRMSELSYMKEV